MVMVLMQGERWATIDERRAQTFLAKMGKEESEKKKSPTFEDTSSSWN